MSLLGLLGRSPDHPLASAKEAQRIAADLARQAPAKAVDEAGGWFASLAGVDGFAPAQRLERIVEIAVASLPAARRQARDFLLAPPAGRPQEQQQWRLNHDYWLHLAQALERCRTDAAADTKAEAALRPQLPVLLTGLLLAYGWQARWLRLRLAAIPNEHWARLGDCYLHAVREGVATTAVQPFDAVEGTTSPAAEYLKALLLHASAAHSLSRAEIGLAERIALRLLPHFALRETASPGTLLWIDAARPMPPTRPTAPPAAMAGLRFIAAADVLPALQALRETLARTPELPAELSQGAAYASAAVARVFGHLATCWSAAPPTRKHARHRIASQVGVIGGLPSLSRIIAGAGVEGFQRWQVEDISQGGLSVRLPLLKNDWMKIGALLGYQPEGGAQWLIGVVRRFARISEIEGTAGIETLARAPRLVTAMDDGLQTDLILLDALGDGGTVRALLPPSHWDDGMTLVALVDGRPWRFGAEERLEVADDWLLARYSAARLAD